MWPEAPSVTESGLSRQQEKNDVKTGERVSRVAALEYAKVLEGRTDGDVRGIS